MLPLLAAILAAASPPGLATALTTLMDDERLVNSLVEEARPVLVCMRRSMPPGTLGEARDLAEARAYDQAFNAAGKRCGLGAEVEKAAARIRSSYPSISAEDAAGAAEMLFGLAMHAVGS